MLVQDKFCVCGIPTVPNFVIYTELKILLFVFLLLWEKKKKKERERKKRKEKKDDESSSSTIVSYLVNFAAVGFFGGW